MEKLAETVGIDHNSFDTFEEKLSGKYAKNKHPLGFDEWVEDQTEPSSCQVGHLAYEFGNGFMVFNFIQPV